MLIFISHFAVPSVLNRIAEALPGAYVLAEIVVEGQTWVVARPLRDAPSDTSYAVPDDDWRAGLGDVGGLQRFGDYLDVLAQATVERLPPLSLPDANAHGEERWPVSPENRPVIPLS